MSDGQAGLHDLATDVTRELTTLTFGLPVMDDGADTWALLNKITDAVTAELELGAGAGFELSAEVSERTWYPLHRKFSEAVTGLAQFRDLLGICGVANGYLPAAGDPPSPHELYRLIYEGASAGDVLAKNLMIIRSFYDEHRDEAIAHPGEMIDAIVTLNDVFQANKSLLAEIWPDKYPRAPLRDLKTEIWALEEKIMTADQGPLGAFPRYRNSDVALTFYASGAVQVTIDSQAPDARTMGGRNENLWHAYGTAVREAGVMSNWGSMRGGVPNTYTIPAGADMNAVLRGLQAAGMITLLERDLLRNQLHLQPFEMAGAAALSGRGRRGMAGGGGLA